MFAKTDLYAQPRRFVVKPTSFSSRISDEFSPAYYKNGIVFCSNQRDNSLISYSNEKSRLYKLFFVARKDSTGWRSPEIFSKEITSGLNDGPATFDATGNIMYYSRNNPIENSFRNVSDTSNKMGIYSAELINGKWTNIKPFTYNNLLYSFGTPSLSPDGKRIYFSSDMPGGFGGMDLYYCDLENDAWGKPVNLGPVINTPKSESFPFAGNYSELYFASDGHKGLGGKDLYYTQQINGEWINPVHLDSAINSPFDDFGIVTDSTFENGYFSSNRRKTDDVFSFNTAPVDFNNCDTVKENNYCFTFYDEKYKSLDTIQTTYKWEFGDSVIYPGKEVRHCFPGPGNYLVKLSITDNLTGKMIAENVEYKVELKNIDQAYIKSSDDFKVGKPILFEGVTTDLKGITITDYLWNFGDGFKIGGPKMNTAFKKGEYLVKLGLLTARDSLGTVQKKCIMKKIHVN